MMDSAMLMRPSSTFERQAMLLIPFHPISSHFIPYFHLTSYSSLFLLSRPNLDPVLIPVLPQQCVPFVLGQLQNIYSSPAEQRRIPAVHFLQRADASVTPLELYTRSQLASISRLGSYEHVLSCIDARFPGMLNTGSGRRTVAVFVTDVSIWCLVRDCSLCLGVFAAYVVLMVLAEVSS